MLELEHTSGTQLPEAYRDQLVGIELGSAEYNEAASMLLELLNEEMLGKSSQIGEIAIDASIQQESSPYTSANEADLPTGYKSAALERGAASLDPGQFDGKIHSFANGSNFEGLDVTEFKTENGVSVRVCDLRPSMTAKVRKAGPSGQSTNRLLDKNFFSDVKRHAELSSSDHSEASPGGKSVVQVPGIRYSSIKGSQVRAYWMVVRDKNSPKIMTIARLADCDNGANYERDLYRRVFKLNMPKK